MSDLKIPYPLTKDLEYFPPAHLALKEPNGLLAIGGDLQPQRLLAAYRQGIFPWYDTPPILWWSPEPRTILFLDQVHISRSMKKVIRQSKFNLKMDEQFSKVVLECAIHRQEGTWLTTEMQSAYIALHELGYAHALAVYQGELLVGGIYGIALGKLFFGESMFSLEPNASKIAIIYLAKQLQKWGFLFIDCQIWSPHLASLGAISLPRAEFLAALDHNNKLPSKLGKWTLDDEFMSGSSLED